MQRLDRRTGLPYGDHGTAQEAIDYLLSDGGQQAPGEETAFLRNWLVGDLDREWPEYYDWLQAQRGGRIPFEVNWRLVAAILSAALVWRELLELARFLWP